jgi:hypothetical protein
LTITNQNTIIELGKNKIGATGLSIAKLYGRFSYRPVVR